LLPNLNTSAGSNSRGKNCPFILSPPELANPLKWWFEAGIHQFGDLTRFVVKLLRTANVREIDSYMPIYFLFIDDISPVFTMPSFSEKAIEYGFFYN
jgi:hypothetical protein